MDDKMSGCTAPTAAVRDEFAYFEHLTQAVLITDTVLSVPGPRILYANPAFEAMTGWPRQEIVGRTPRVLQGPATDRACMQALKAALQRGESWAGETTNYRRDGTPFEMRWTIAPVRGCDGAVQRYLAVQEDVTDQRARERREAYLGAMTQQLMAAASEGIVVTDAQQRITSFGAGAESTFGWQAREVLGEPISILMPEHARQAHPDHMRDFAARNLGVRHMAERGEVTALHRDGTEFPALITVADLGQHGGNGFIAVVRDLSIRRTQARQLADSERRYRALFDLTFQFVGLLDAGTRVLAANQTALAFFGGTMSAVRDRYFIDTPWFDGSPAARDTAKAALDKAIGGEFVRGQFDLRKPDGTLRHFDFSIRPVFDADGAVEYLIPEGRDVTDLVRSTEALKTRERQLNEAQRIAEVGDWRWDITSGWLYWSNETYRIFGMDPSRQPTYAEFLAAVHPDDRDDVEAGARAALAGTATYALDHRIVLPDGAERMVHEQAEVKRDSEGRPEELVGIVQDVTERKRLEQALLDAKRDAETANEAKSRFLSTMGHELRTPLNAINGFSELIAAETFGPVGSQQYSEYAKLIQQSGEHLLDVINTILDATRIESGRMELAADWFAAGGFLSQTLDLARAESDLESSQIVLQAPPEVALFADRRLLRQAVLNLLANAAKFSPPGGTVTVDACLSDRGAFEITVRDTGPGIPAEAIEQVTMPFFQADDSLSRRHQGSGLGLYLAKSFLGLHGGDLELAASPDSGTVATLRLPADRVQPDE